MKAKVTKPFSGAPDGQHHPKHWNVGEVVEGNLADVAIAQKWADPVKEKASDQPKLGLPEQKQGASAEAAK